MTTITDDVVKKIIRRLLSGNDYRIEVITLINAMFLQYVVDFFRQIVDAKLKNESVTSDWYKKEFLNPNLSSKELIINSGLNAKTITNAYNSCSRNIVLEATTHHYQLLYEAINNLVDEGSDIDVTLTIKLNGVSVDLNINESLIVINTLAVKRAELRGGAWSTAGKQVEKYLMLVLCKLYSVSEDNYELTGLTKAKREVDFYLISQTGEKYLCEVKLMGKGNPESADAIYARESNIFVADKLSDTSKNQMDHNHIEWVELRSEHGYKRFYEVLKNLSVPSKDFTDNLDNRLNEILSELF